MAKLTRQGVRDLNDLGGRRVNGKRPPCPHFFEDLYVKDHIRRETGDINGELQVWWVGILACEACNEILGPEDEFDETPGVAA